MNTTTRSGRFARLAGVGIGLISLGASIFTVGASAEETKPGTSANTPLTKILTKYNFGSEGWVDNSLGEGSIELTDDFGGSLGQAGTEGEDAPGALVLRADTGASSLAQADWILDRCAGGGYSSSGYCQDPANVGVDGQLRLGDIDFLRYDQLTGDDFDKAALKVEIRAAGPGGEYATAVFTPTAKGGDLANFWQRFNATNTSDWKLHGRTAGEDCASGGCSFAEIKEQMGDDAIVASIQFGLGSSTGTGRDLQAVVDNFVYKFAERGTATDGRFRAWNPEERFYAQTVEAPPAKPQVSILNNGMTVNHRGVFTYGAGFEAFTVEVLAADGVTAIDGQKVSIWRVEAVPGLPQQLLCDAVTNDQGIASCAYDGGSDPTFYDVKVRAVVKGDYGTKAVGKTAAMAYGSF